MRITGGEHCRLRIKVPAGAIRPTQDKVREALFSCIGEKICGCRFLDLFAGSGAVGLDAWSRGAEFVCWVESNPRVLATLRENVERICGPRAIACPRKPRQSLVHGGELSPAPQTSAQKEEPLSSACGGLRRAVVARGDAIRFLKKRASGSPFNIIFADPPYDRNGRHGWLRKALQALGSGSMLTDKGIFVMEQSADEPAVETAEWVLTRKKKYGATQLLFFEQAASTQYKSTQ